MQKSFAGTTCSTELWLQLWLHGGIFYSFFYEDKKITSWVQNGKKSVYFDCQKVDYKNQHIRKVDSIIEIINDENNEPNHIIVTKPSAILSGLLETTKYQLSNYPQDLDLIELIKTNKLDSTIEELNLPKGEKIVKLFVKMKLMKKD